MRLRYTGPLALVLLLGSCASDAADQVQTTPIALSTEATVTTSASTTLGTTTTAQTTTLGTTTAAATAPTASPGSRTIVVGGTPRTYQLDVPSSIDPSVAAPLVLSFHGIHGSASDQISYTNFVDIAESEGIVVVHPIAFGGVWDLETGTDVEFVAEIIDDVSTMTAIDPDRVYAIGYSQGGALATLLACRLPERIAAVASVAVLVHHDLPACGSPAAARVLALAGESDRIYSIEDGLSPAYAASEVDPAGPLAAETADWSTTNGCDGEPTETTSSEGVIRREYACANGSALVVYVHPGGHSWFQDSYGLDFNTVIWDFLRQYSMPLSPG